MLYTDQTRLAMQTAYQAHAGQTDRGGVPYLYHPVHLAEQMTTETAICAALLHDVPEDTEVDLAALRALGFSEEVLAAVALLTHSPATPYLDYVRAIRESGNPDAIAVKLADLRHNSDPTRLKHSANDPRTKELLARYGEAIRILTEGEAAPRRE